MIVIVANTAPGLVIAKGYQSRKVNLKSLHFKLSFKSKTKRVAVEETSSIRGCERSAGSTILLM